jgi:hypothetical protein
MPTGISFPPDGVVPPGTEVVELTNAIPPLDPENFAPVCPYRWDELSPTEYQRALAAEIARRQRA